MDRNETFAINLPQKVEQQQRHELWLLLLSLPQPEFVCLVLRRRRRLWDEDVAIGWKWHNKEQPRSNWFGGWHHNWFNGIHYSVGVALCQCGILIPGRVSQSVSEWRKRAATDDGDQVSTDWAGVNINSSGLRWIQDRLSVPPPFGCVSLTRHAIQAEPSPEHRWISKWVTDGRVWMDSPRGGVTEGTFGGLDKGGWVDGVNVEFMGNIYGGGLSSALVYINRLQLRFLDT